MYNYKERLNKEFNNEFQAVNDSKQIYVLYRKYIDMTDKISNKVYHGVVTNEERATSFIEVYWLPEKNRKIKFYSFEMFTVKIDRNLYNDNNYIEQIVQEIEQKIQYLQEYWKRFE